MSGLNAPSSVFIRETAACISTSFTYLTARGHLHIQMCLCGRRTGERSDIIHSRINTEAEVTMLKGSTITAEDDVTVKCLMLWGLKSFPEPTAIPLSHFKAFLQLKKPLGESRLGYKSYFVALLPSMSTICRAGAHIEKIKSLWGFENKQES